MMINFFSNHFSMKVNLNYKISEIKIFLKKIFLFNYYNRIFLKRLINNLFLKFKLYFYGYKIIIFNTKPYLNNKYFKTKKYFFIKFTNHRLG